MIIHLIKPLHHHGLGQDIHLYLVIIPLGKRGSFFFQPHGDDRFSLSHLQKTCQPVPDPLTSSSHSSSNRCTLFQASLHGKYILLHFYNHFVLSNNLLFNSIQTLLCFNKLPPFISTALAVHIMQVLDRLLHNGGDLPWHVIRLS